MNNSLNVIRRLLRVRDCNRIISSSYCDSRKVDKNSAKEVFDSSTEPKNPVKTTANFSHEGSSSITGEPNYTSSKAIQDMEVNDLSTDGNVKQPNAQLIENTAQISGKDYHAGMKMASEAKSGEGVKKSVTQFHSKNEKAPADGFLAAYNKQDKIVKEKVSPPPSETFVSLLRKSPFVDLGDPVGKVVIGEIYHAVGNDLYIDFGWKFHTVCPKPRKNPENYVPGAKVLLKIKDLELSTKFLGDKTHISLLEADCDIVGILYGREKEQKTEL